MPPQRIMIVGLPGAGKSTFARKISHSLQIACYHIDRYYWKPNWQKYTVPEWLVIHQALIDQPSWIIEGCAIKSSFMERFARADLVIYFNFPRLLCLWRMIKRSLLPMQNDTPDGCIDGVPWRLIKYMWQFDTSLMQPLWTLAQKKYPHVKVIAIRNDSEACSILKELLFLKSIE